MVWVLCEAVQTPPVPMDSVGNVSVSLPPRVLYLLELCVSGAGADPAA